MHFIYAKPPHRKQIRRGGTVFVEAKTARSHDFPGVPAQQKIVRSWENVPDFPFAYYDFATSHAIWGIRNVRTWNTENANLEKYICFMCFISACLTTIPTAARQYIWH